MADVKPAASIRPSPAKPTSEGAQAPAGVVFVDYLGAPDREGHRRPGHKIAPIVAGSAKGLAHLITIRPGLTVHASVTWLDNCPEPKEGVKAKPGSIRELVDAGHLVVLKGLPTDAEVLLELASRTQSPLALQTLIDHELNRKGGGKDKKPSRARASVLSALKAHKATADLRAKSPVAPGDQRRLAASRVLH